MPLGVASGSVVFYDWPPLGWSRDGAKDEVGLVGVRSTPHRDAVQTTIVETCLGRLRLWQYHELKTQRNFHY